MGNKHSAEERAKRKEERAARKKTRLQKAWMDKDGSTVYRALNFSDAAPSRLEETVDQGLAASLSRLRSATPATPSTRLADISSALSQAMLDSSTQQPAQRHVVAKTPDELANENRRLQRQIARTERRADELESYINDLLEKVLECCPELLIEPADAWTSTTMTKPTKRDRKQGRVS